MSQSVKNLQDYSSLISAGQEVPGQSTVLSSACQVGGGGSLQLLRRSIEQGGRAKRVSFCPPCVMGTGYPCANEDVHSFFNFPLPQE